MITYIITYNIKGIKCKPGYHKVKTVQARSEKEAILKLIELENISHTDLLIYNVL